MNTFLAFGKRNSKMTSPLSILILLRSFWPFRSLKFEVKMGPQTLADPKLDIFQYPMWLRYVEGWWGFQDIDSPRCTIISHDLKDSGLLIFQDVLSYFKISKIAKIDIPRYTKIPQKTIFQTVLRFHHSSKKYQRLFEKVTCVQIF